MKIKFNVVDKKEKGTYIIIESSRRGVSETKREGEIKKTAILYCPNCGGAMGLWNHHINANDGEVSPSVVCPLMKTENGITDYCRFHDFVILEDWKV